MALSLGGLGQPVQTTVILPLADRKGFDRKAAGLLERSRGLFTLLFEPPGPGAGGKPASRYTPEARILPGYRGVSLPVGLRPTAGAVAARWRSTTTTAT